MIRRHIPTANILHGILVVAVVWFGSLLYSSRMLLRTVPLFETSTFGMIQLRNATSLAPPNILVVVPGLGVSANIPTLAKSLQGLSASLKLSSVGFKCLIYVWNRTLVHEASERISQCDVVYNKGYWTHHMVRVNGALLKSIGGVSHIALVLDDVDATRINASTFLETMHRSKFDVASAADPLGDYPLTMRPRGRCRSHRTDFVNPLFAIFTRDAWLCYHRLIDVHQNPLGWGPESRLADDCNAVIGIVDDAIMIHIKKTSSYNYVEAGDQMYAWFTKSVTGVSTRAQAALYYELVTKIRPKSFPYCKEYRVGLQGDACARIKELASCNESLARQQSVSFILGDSSFAQAKHGSGWNSILKYLVEKSIVENADPALRELVWNKQVCPDAHSETGDRHGILLSTRRDYFRARLHCGDAFDVSRQRQKFLLVGFTENWFLWNKRGMIDIPWVGIMHLVHKTPPHLASLSTASLFNESDFLKSLPNCVGIVVLTKDQVKPVERAISKHSSGKTRPGVQSISYPIAINDNAKPYDSRADLDATFLEGHGVLLLGRQYQRVATIYKLQTNGRPKFWMPGGEILDYRNVVEAELNVDGGEYDDNVTIVHDESSGNHDQMIRQNIVVIDVWASTANDAIIEAMALHIPVFVRKLVSTVEYLGNDYPLFFSSFDELQSILLGSDDRLRWLLLRGHRYLKRMDKSRFSVEKFGESLKLSASQARN